MCCFGSVAEIVDASVRVQCICFWSLAVALFQTSVPCPLPFRVMIMKVFFCASISAFFLLCWHKSLCLPLPLPPSPLPPCLFCPPPPPHCVHVLCMCVCVCERERERFSVYVCLVCFFIYYICILNPFYPPPTTSHYIHCKMLSFLRIYTLDYYHYFIIYI